MSNIELKKRVMARIYVEYAKNILFRYAEYIFPLMIAFSLFMSISIGNIIENMPKDSAGSTLNFILSAVKNTEWTIQLMLATVLSFGLLHLSRIAIHNART